MILGSLLETDIIINELGDIFVIFDRILEANININKELEDIHVILFDY